MPCLETDCQTERRGSAEFFTLTDAYRRLFGDSSESYVILLDLCELVEILDIIDTDAGCFQCVKSVFMVQRLVREPARLVR